MATEKADKLQVTLRFAGHPGASQVLELDREATLRDVRLATGLDEEWFFAQGKGEGLVDEDQPLGRQLVEGQELYAARKATKGA